MLDLTGLKTLSIQGIDLVKLTLNGIQIWKKPASFKNWAFNSLESGGNAIYNNGLGYKTGYRVRSGGVEAAEIQSICTGFIPLKRGETLRIYPPFNKQNSNNAINFSDENFTNLGQITDTNAGYGICAGTQPYYKTSVVNGVSTLTLNENTSADIKYVRVTHVYQPDDIAESTMNNGYGVGKWVKTDASNFIITVNEELEVPT